ncbi:hypothetical protein E2C01_044483 [Portunus trituberculatus]|uniref:Uncharacterized protein n=1 Tax=Portunus trituberculatus TaxID=210409 RepID=A0A5B7G2G7_PORTR|nr:hypothetical protein [Portunus trituberculatus]
MKEAGNGDKKEDDKKSSPEDQKESRLKEPRSGRLPVLSGAPQRLHRCFGVTLRHGDNTRSLWTPKAGDELTSQDRLRTEASPFQYFRENTVKGDTYHLP